MNKKIMWMADVTAPQKEREYCSWWCWYTQVCHYDPCPAAG
jgi:hypothetical protein